MSCVTTKHVKWLGMGRYHIFADMPILTSADTLILPIPILSGRAASADISVSAYRQPFLIADTDTADTEKCADMPIFPIPILVSAHPYKWPLSLSGRKKSLSGTHLSQTEVECIFRVLYAGPPETTLHPNQGSRNVQCTGALDLHFRLRQCIFNLHWTLPAVYIQCSLIPATWLSFLYHTAFYQVPYNSCKNDLSCLAKLSDISTLYFKAYAPKLVLYVCLFYLISSYVILLDSLYHRIPICFV